MIFYIAQQASAHDMICPHYPNPRWASIGLINSSLQPLLKHTHYPYCSAWADSSGYGPANSPNTGGQGRDLGQSDRMLAYVRTAEIEA